MYIPFSQWLPDRFDLNNPGVEVAKNCLPSKDGFTGFLSYVRESVDASGTATIDGNCKGLVSSVDGAGTPFTFVGDETKLYRYQGDFSFADVSKVGGYTAVDQWEFTQFDNLTIATGYNDDVQAFEGGVDLIFRDLGGTPPRAKYCATILDFAVLANVVDATGDQPTRVWRSARNDPEDWTENAATQCGFGNIPDNGPITGLSGGGFGIVLCYAGVHRLTYVGSPQVFQADDIGKGIGCEVPGSVIERADARGILATVFFLGTDGFAMTGGETVTQIANDRVNQWFFETFDASRQEQMFGGVYGLKDSVLWTFPSINAVDQNDMYIAFSYANNAWAYGELDVEFFGQTESPVRLLEDITELVNDVTHRVDSSIWNASNSRFGAIDHEGYFGTFVGTPLIPTFETGDVRATQMRKSRIGRVMPDADGIESTQIATGNVARNLGAFGQPAVIKDQGFTSHRGSSKFGQINRIRVNGASAFTDISGIDAEVIPGGN